jgi:methionyl aminopeptidase
MGSQPRGGAARGVAGEPAGPRGIVLRSARELEVLRQAGRIVAQVLAELGAAVGPGIETRELDLLAERSIRAAGAIPTFKGYHGFPASICVSVNEAVVHGIPGSRRLRPGDIVSCDVGATWNGYVGDGAWTFGVPPLTPEAARLLEATQRALEAGIAAARVGARVGDISHAVQAVAEGAGFSVVRRYCGHGVGTDMHEEPQVPNYGSPGTGPVLRAGMVLAIEPMVNAGTYDVRVLRDGWTVVTRDGRPSAHFEHTVAIRDGGADILTLP